LVTGDGTDNIPSYDGKLRNAIPQFMQKLIDPIDEMGDEWEMYQYCKNLYFGFSNNDENDEDRLHRNAQLIYILKEEGKYWQPPEKANMMSGPTLDIMPSSSECYDKEQDDIHPSSNV
jgi:hypothetical protein